MAVIAAARARAQVELETAPKMIASAFKSLKESLEDPGLAL